MVDPDAIMAESGQIQDLVRDRGRGSGVQAAIGEEYPDSDQAEEDSFPDTTSPDPWRLSLLPKGMELTSNG